MTDLPYLVFPLLYVSNMWQKIKEILFCLVVWAEDLIYTGVSEITSQVIWSLKWALLPHINILLHFSCDRKGSQLYFMSLNQICMPIIATQSSDMYQKIILNRDLAIWSFISLLIWKQNLHLILLVIANNLIYVKLLFWGSVLLHKLIWDSSSCRGMIYYLCFRRCIRFTI